MSVPPVYNIGALSIDIHPLKYSLKSEADSWKALYSKQFHEKGFEDLKVWPPSVEAFLSPILTLRGRNYEARAV